MNRTGLFLVAFGVVPALVWAADDGVFDTAVDVVAPAPSAAAPAPALGWSATSVVEFGAVATPPSGGALATTTLALDADPRPGLHVRTALEAAVPGTPSVSLTELWAQASTAASWFVRLGLQPLKWQTARVFDTVDLADHVGDDLSARGQAIVGPVTLEAVVSAPVPVGGATWGEPSLASTTSLVSLGSVTSAGRLEVAVPHGAVAVAARQSAISEVAPSLRLTLGKVDLFGETIVQHQFGAPGYFTGAVVGFFTECSPVQVYGEWSWDGRRATAPSQNQAVLAARWLEALVPTGQVGVEWRHSFSDGTGRVVPGVSAEVLPGVRTDLGLSISYHSTDPSGLYFAENTTAPAALGTRVRVSVSY